MPVFETVKKESKPMTDADYVEGMKVFDRDLVGYLNSGELRHLLTFMGTRWTAASSKPICPPNLF